MAELRRTFYVKMRVNNNARNFISRHHEKPSSCYIYFKWLIWASLTLYLLTAYFISTPTSLPQTTLHRGSTASRALIESNKTTSFPKQIAIPALADLRVYVYKLPASYNADWLANPRCSEHLFVAEVALHRAILKSEARTRDPYEADFFFVPVYVSCNFSSVNGFPSIAHARPLLASAINLISSDLPFWNRSNGADHVFVASHDYGSCFHAMEDKAVEDGIPEFLRSSIVLQMFGVEYPHPCQNVANVVIPQYVSQAKVRQTLAGALANGERDIWAFFRGKMEVHPKNISGQFYSKKVRAVIWERFSRDMRFYIKRHRFAGYQAEIARSTFYLCPLGWAPWSPRLVESVMLGCVPVIIADSIHLPFASVIPWSDISLSVPESDIRKLDKILDHVAATNMSLIQRNLWNSALRSSLLFNEEIIEGDATWHVLRELVGFRDRSRVMRI